MGRIFLTLILPLVALSFLVAEPVFAQGAPGSVTECINQCKKAPGTDVMKCIDRCKAKK